MLVESRDLDAPALADALGWSVQPEGLCRDGVCIPLSGARTATAVAQALQMPLVHDPDVNLWAVGPPAAPHAIQSAEAPNLKLPDLDGRLFELASLRGSKVLLLAWASW